MARIVVSGWVAQYPTAPFLWHALSFALGFQQLGHEVWFLEDPGDSPVGWDVLGDQQDDEVRAGVAFLARELAHTAMAGRWAVRHVPTGRCDGMSEPDLLDVLAQADVLVNVSLRTPTRPEYAAIPCRLAIDTDPVFTQVRIAQGDPVLGPVPDLHTRLFSFGRPPLPASRHEWVHTRQPVVLDSWPVQGAPDPAAPFTSVLAWQSYPPVHWAGAAYGAKDVTFLEFLGLPALTRVGLQLAIGGSGAQAGARTLSGAGWRVSPARDATLSTAAYQSFLRGSAGEFGLAKHGYVASRSGWFSERTCCYLASGRPAVVQDTGWTDWLPSGEGLVPFGNLEGAVVALEEVSGNLARHAAAARRLAEEHFAAAAVCADLLSAV